jgi:hypothetical protein
MKGNREKGRIVAAILSSAWRQTPLPLTVSADQLATVTPLLLATGAAGLAYRRICHHSPLTAHHAPAQELRRAHSVNALHAPVQQQHLCDLLARLRGAGIEPLIVKGWSAARLYPDPAVRPTGDIDLCVRPEDMLGTMAVLTDAAGRCGSVDLHEGVADLDRPLGQVFARSRLVPLHSGRLRSRLATEVRILGVEDQFRHLCLHLMRHGGWRPLWLCDVAVMLESLPADFDWGYCLWGDRWRSDWVHCAIGLAQELLGAELRSLTLPPRQEPVPPWLVASVLESWGRGAESNDAVGEPITASLRSWSNFADALCRRWPNPIRAAFKLRASPRGRFPLMPMKLLAFLLRAGQYAVSRVCVPPAAEQPFEVHPVRVR